MGIQVHRTIDMISYVDSMFYARGYTLFALKSLTTPSQHKLSGISKTAFQNSSGEPLGTEVNTKYIMYNYGEISPVYMNSFFK